MGQPIEIKNGDDLMYELMATSSSLNMRVLEDETASITADTYLSDLYWGKHAYGHLMNIMKFFIDNDVIITINEIKE